MYGETCADIREGNLVSYAKRKWAVMFDGETAKRVTMMNQHRQLSWM